MDEILGTSGLVKKFSATTGVDGVSFSLKRGRILAYLGHNGAGKTTTIRSLLGLLKADAGEIRYFGSACDTASAGFDRTRRDVGVCLDAPGFYPELNAVENLRMFAGLYGLAGAEFEKRAAELLDRLGLAAAAKKSVKSYSKGMAQKLALARAIQHRPKLLFLDEPMSGLDPEARITMRDFLADLAGRERVAIFLTSHDLNEVEQIAHDVAILENGRMKLYGELGALKDGFMKNAGYLLVLEEEPTPGQQEALAGALGAVKREVHGREFRAELRGGLALDSAAAACARAGVKLTEFKKERATLEEIYFESLSKHENRN